jgi:two-component system repressor protein LuxO
MCAYDWPGNIRQLENVIHGMVILNSGEQITSEMIIKSLSTTVKNYSAIQPMSVKKQYIPSNEQPNTSNLAPETEATTNTVIKPLWQVEKNAIESAILFCDGNIPKAAAMLEVSPSTIYRKKLGW